MYWDNTATRAPGLMVCLKCFIVVCRFYVLTWWEKIKNLISHYCWGYPFITYYTSSSYFTCLRALISDPRSGWRRTPYNPWGRGRHKIVVAGRQTLYERLLHMLHCLQSSQASSSKLHEIPCPQNAWSNKFSIFVASKFVCNVGCHCMKVLCPVYSWMTSKKHTGAQSGSRQNG